MGADTLDYDRQMAAEGMRELSVPALRRLRNLGVTPMYVRDVRRAGTPIDAPADAVELWIHEVPATFTRELASAGMPLRDPAQILEMHIHKVPPRFVAALREPRRVALPCGKPDACTTLAWTRAIRRRSAPYPATTVSSPAFPHSCPIDPRRIR